jgi:hypothetical protein
VIVCHGFSCNEFTAFGYPTASSNVWVVGPAQQRDHRPGGCCRKFDSQRCHQWVYGDEPRDRSLLPPAAAPGGTITINGSGFQLDASQTIQVLFNGISFTPNQFGATSIIAQVPSNATSGPVTVVVGGVCSNSVSFTAEQQPTITSVSPSTGPLNSRRTVVPVTIGGAGFGATQSG